MELFTFRAMQTDPNWSNFLWNPLTRQVRRTQFSLFSHSTLALRLNWLTLVLRGRTAKNSWIIGSPSFKQQLRVIGRHVSIGA